MRILFAGGGTAGHISPALAIAEIITDRYSEAEIAFVGRNNGSENKAIENEGYKLYTLDVMGFQRSLSKKNFSAIKKLIKSQREARNILSDYTPDLVIGTGGYVCYPILKSSIKKKIPTLIHESNAYPGLVTRILSGRCNCVMIGEDSCRKYLGTRAKCETVGNPIRKKFVEVSRQRARALLNVQKEETFILSFGGSGGADVLNDTVIKVMRSYSAKAPKVKHVHATGKTHFAKIENNFPDLCRGISGCKVIPYIDNMPIMMNAADIVISRSGAMTLAEIKVTDAIPILIPSPNVAANHQYHNAKVLEESREALLIEEDTLSDKALTKLIDELISSPEKRRKIIEKKRISKSIPQNKRILDIIDKYIT